MKAINEMNIKFRTKMNSRFLKTQAIICLSLIMFMEKDFLKLETNIFMIKIYV